MSDLRLRNVTKKFGVSQIIKGVDLDIEDGEFTVFVGPSGCGKSTLLRMISGLEDITSGTLEIGGNVMNDIAPSQRGVAMVFQSYALYPHLNVRDNIAFGLKVRKISKSEIKNLVAEAVAVLKLEDLLDRYPRELSGGQRQRVAIGRAIVSKPDVFLFDEPLSNLDAELRVHMRAEIAKLHGRIGNTMIYVTHDQIEAMTLADKIVVLRDGIVEQVGAPRELYENPKNLFVAQFIGSPKMNVFDLSPAPEAVKRMVQTDISAAQFGIRPEHLNVVSHPNGILSGKVMVSEYTGATALLHVELEGLGNCLVPFEGANPPGIGALVGLDFSHEKLHLFAASGEAVLHRV